MTKYNLADVKGMHAADTEDAPAMFFGSGNGDGYSMFVMIGTSLKQVLVPPAGVSQEALLAFSARATATLRGDCILCGAVVEIDPDRYDEMLSMQMAHEDGCPVEDKAFVSMLRSECPDYDPRRVLPTTYEWTAQGLVAHDLRQPKMPRNDPCPCGSGQKYKRCCGAP